jgi:hypothetical protein
LSLLALKARNQFQAAEPLLVSIVSFHFAPSAFMLEFSRSRFQRVVTLSNLR